MTKPEMTEQETQCGFVAVLGAPNAGKSTLINQLVGAKVSIVSPKVQTTRTIVRGIVMRNKAQIILVDTPGIFVPKKRLERAMVAAAWQGGAEADLILLVVDVSRRHVPDRETQNIIKALKDRAGGVKVALVLNKIDEIRVEKLMGITKALNDEYDFDATFMVSALKAKGTDDIVKWIVPLLPHGPYMYPEDDISDMPMRLLAAEITREKMFNRLHDELPYGLTVETESWREEEGGIVIHQNIIIGRENHKAIILGKGGSQIRAIGESARLELETILGMRVHLKLFVQVNEKWSEDRERYEPWGLAFES